MYNNMCQECKSFALIKQGFGHCKCHNMKVTDITGACKVFEQRIETCESIEERITKLVAKKYGSQDVCVVKIHEWLYEVTVKYVQESVGMTHTFTVKV